MLFSFSSTPLSKTEARSRLIGLAGVTAPFLGAVFYNHGYRISWLVCPLRSLTGIPCPFCGMTRSLMAAARGNFVEAIDYHAFGVLLVGVLLLAVLHWLTELGTGRRVRTFYGRWIRDRRWQLGLGGGFLLYYGMRLVYWIISGDRFWV
ncbi:DUF2752 domain-containing protein [Leptolyngbya ohadii]|uniref:DUF2752 domain-containing protein n=1 Tax=Leptolyngbya ohadii TaxID=1962290 RepID=UPI000B59C908|nr:DUF2752 domain-containing protein [Leptolyngbya ohadii]